MSSASHEIDEHVDDQPLPLITDILDLEQLEVDIFRGRSPDEDLQRVFGGQVGRRRMPLRDPNITRTG